MVLYPNAKINLGLRILERRNDGFHNLETIFIPIGLCDILEFIETKDDHPGITMSGIKIEDQCENIVIRAWRLMNEKYNIPAVDIYLHKLIPVGAGLGGGSSDAAFMLKGLNEYFNCGATLDELESMAGLLGSDCAFFIRNRTSVGTDKGQVLEFIDLSLLNYKILLVHPSIPISTREAYTNIKPEKDVQSLKTLINKPLASWQAIIQNDFEKPIFALYPEIEKIKFELKEARAIYTSMSGSGSSVYGIFHHDADLQNLILKFSEYFTWLGHEKNTI